MLRHLFFLRQVRADGKQSDVSFRKKEFLTLLVSLADTTKALPGMGVIGVYGRNKILSSFLY